MYSRNPAVALQPEPPIAESHFEIESAAGCLTLYVVGEGAPLLLIHSINAAASAAEVKPLIDAFRAQRQVFCLDLPGFGLSERSDRAYTLRLMTDAVQAAANHIRTRNPQPIDALAVSLSCEFLARAAVENPGLFRTLALVSPTGFSGGQVLRGPEGASRKKPWLQALLNGPGSSWGPWLFRQLTRPAVIRYFLKRTWGSAQIDQALWRADVREATRPGAHYAPLCFLSGELFAADIHSVYDRLTLPVWLSHGIRGDFTDYRQTSRVADRRNWLITEYDSGALPYFERPGKFNEDYGVFLRAPISAN